MWSGGQDAGQRGRVDLDAGLWVESRRLEHGHGEVGEHELDEGLPGHISVLEQVQDELLDFDGTGMSILEHSHRGPAYARVHDEAISLLRDLLDVPANYQVLFLQGGASLGFLTAAMNFLPEGGSMDYAVTGTWAKKALKEAKHVGAASALTSSEDTGFDRIPELPSTSSADFVHITTNNTIFGTQYASDPVVDTPLIADMSSSHSGCLPLATSNISMRHG